MIQQLNLKKSDRIMQSMVNRWKDKLNSIQQKQPLTNNIPTIPPKPEITIQHQYTNNMKKSLDKSKKSLHSYQDKISSSKRLTTPSKKKSKNLKSQTIEKACQQIFQIFAKATPTDKKIHSKIKNVLEQVWAKTIQTLETSSPRNNLITNTQLQTSIMRQSTISNSAAKRNERLYQDLEKRYFDCEKQRQFLKYRIQQIIKKYENVQKQLIRYEKMEKLVDRCIQRQQQLKQDNKKLNQQLQLSQLRQIQQQKIFQQQINIVRQLVNQIKINLPKT